MTRPNLQPSPRRHTVMTATTLTRCTSPTALGGNTAAEHQHGQTPHSTRTPDAATRLPRVTRLPGSRPAAPDRASHVARRTSSHAPACNTVQLNGCHPFLLRRTALAQQTGPRVRDAVPVLADRSFFQQPSQVWAKRPKTFSARSAVRFGTPLPAPAPRSRAKHPATLTNRDFFAWDDRAVFRCRGITCPTRRSSGDRRPPPQLQLPLTRGHARQPPP